MPLIGAFNGCLNIYFLKLKCLIKNVKDVKSVFCVITVKNVIIVLIVKIWLINLFV